MGDAEVIQQIKWAVENGYTPSNDALDFLETQPPLLPDKFPHSENYHNSRQPIATSRTISITSYA